MVIFKRLKVKTLDHIRNKLFFNFKKERHLWLKREEVQQHKTVKNYTYKVTSAKSAHSNILRLFSHRQSYKKRIFRIIFQN